MIRLIIILLLFITPNAFADTNFVNETMTAFIAANDIPGAAVVIYTDGKPSDYYYGVANKDKKTPVTKNTIFEVGSITKLMTSLLLAEEVDSVKVQLDDSVTQYISRLPSSYEDITLGNLATHTAGLPFEGIPTHAPDEQWMYSNVGVGLLGEALQNISHQNINALYLKKIISPLKMAPVAITVPAGYQHFMATGYDRSGAPVNAHTSEFYPSAWGFKASAMNMQRFLAAAIGLPGTPDSILYPMRMTQSEYVRLPDRKQGLGWEIHPLHPEKIAGLLDEPEQKALGPIRIVTVYDKYIFNNETLIDKTGHTDGFSAYIAVIPVKKTGIVILANRRVSNAAIVNTARNILFKLNDIHPVEHVEAH